MEGSNLAVLEETKNVVMGDLDLALKVAMAPHVSRSEYTAARRLPLLAHIRQLLQIDCSTIDFSQTGGFPAAKETAIVFLKAVLAYHREISAELERLLQIKDPLRRNRIRKLIGPYNEIESVLEALEDKIEDLEIATSSEVQTAINRLIDEAKTS